MESTSVATIPTSVTCRRSYVMGGLPLVFRYSSSKAKNHLPCDEPTQSGRRAQATRNAKAAQSAGCRTMSRPSPAGQLKTKLLQEQTYGVSHTANHESGVQAG